MIVDKITNHVFCSTLKKRGANSIKHLDAASRDAIAISEKLILDIVQDNKDTEYGKKYGFADIKSIEDYKKKVPFSTYDDYYPYIKRMIENDEEDLITVYPIRHYALSSGSVGVPKHIPVSQKTLDSYSIYAANMAFGVLDEFYKTTTGKTFEDGMCLNTLEAPPMWTENGVTKGAISGTMLRPLADRLKYFMTSPSELIFPEGVMDLKYLKIRFALEERNVMCMVSAFMTGLVDLMTYMENNWESLCDDIEQGCISKEINISDELRDKFNSMLKPNKERAQELRAEFEKGFDTPIVPRIWKNMRWVAAIGTGGFAQYTQKMRQYTGKNIPYSMANYAASESMMAVARRAGDESFVLLPDGGFYEFIPMDSDDEETTLTIDQLEKGKDYEIVVTNLSGFYRYKIKDVIRVTGFYNEAPMIQFIYRKNQMISIAGEKTNEEALRWAMQKFQDDTNILLRDYSIFADTETKPGRYIILIEPDKELDKSRYEECRDIIEKRLGEANPSFGSKIATNVLGRTKLCVTQSETYMLYRDMMLMKGVSQNQLKPVRVIDTPMKEKFFFNLLEGEVE
ncbi:GH3 auxin-responsive promoter family protein [Eubacterium oxidoreducens]|uniref:GH3 auxin-responsive promoter n=1 Tax=Eubacterium oxidoreducens TaxID=1732 RepID=A0A1G6ATZ0_EUBOX|nr:GH3 auxin-responsive promoter family protein [Eubacterium oxidoreducens]SDB11861.1 GH3 auxin-responsive promoter [Eubacterium oxidoreducens]